MKLRTWLTTSRPYLLVIAGCLQFVVLTAVAMLFHPGGVETETGIATRYLFTLNFFSDLGLTVANNQPNTISASLFFIALSSAGLALILFFITFPALFKERRHWRILTILGSIAGIISGFGYLGVAFTPANLYLQAHIDFVRTAFIFFFFAVLLYLIPLWQAPFYPNKYMYIFALFSVALVAYIWLLFNGPPINNQRNLMIHVVSQKLIVYAAIISSLIQAYAAYQITQNQQL